MIYYFACTSVLIRVHFIYYFRFTIYYLLIVNFSALFEFSRCNSDSCLLYSVFSIPPSQFCSPIVSSWHWWRSVVAVRVTRWCRGHGWMPRRAGYNYNAAAVPGMVAPVGDTAGKGDYQDSEFPAEGRRGLSLQA